jgi:hypothetical protein
MVEKKEDSITESTKTKYKEEEERGGKYSVVVWTLMTQ